MKLSSEYALYLLCFNGEELKDSFSKNIAITGQQIATMEILTFANPKARVPLMSLNPLSALELPLKILVWQDEQKKCCIAFNEANYIKDRYELPDALTVPLNLMPLVNKALTEN